MALQEEKKKENISFPEREEEVLDFWDKAHTFEKSLAKDAPQGNYTFYDGPPFATGTPHYGHIVGSVMKDIIPRYQTMRGYHVERKWGWDCHGLPIENIVEKELETKSKKDIEDLGVAKFNNLCRSRVSTYIDDWKKTIKRLGRWADLESSYKTMDLDFMESIWWSFKSLWDKGLIYQDYRSMHVCPRCETTLSQSEVSEGYKDIKDLSATVKFELSDEPGTYFLAWTTTPWTLIGNVALAVGGDIKYVKVRVKKEDKEENYILAKKLLDDIFPEKNYEIIEKYEGYDLVGRSYQPLFDYYSSDQTLANHDNGWKVYNAKFVTTSNGTGIVHIAPAFGEEDMELGKEKKLPFVQHLGLNGVFKKEVKDFPGLHVKPRGDHSATDIEIIKYLAHQGTLFSKAKYEHSYPHCWRCNTPLINYATSSWFVNVTKIKKDLLKNAQGINWFPKYIKEGRFGNWLEGAHDWSISRQRFWASAIPIWECSSCGHKKVVGSVAELEELTKTKITDIHKDKVDPLTFKCPQCGGEMKRVSDVLDCWFESSSMPFAQLHYPFENKEKFENNFPAQFIAEGIDQTRTWFYYLHVIAGGIFGKRSFDNAIANGIVLAEDGKKMSKSLQNYPDPYLIMEKYGSDALRAYLVSSPVVRAENLNFSEKEVQGALRKNIIILWNIYKFYQMFASEFYSQEEASGKEDKKENEKEDKKEETKNILDQWILIKLNNLIKEVSTRLNEYNLSSAFRAITEFIDELSTWYLRRSRDRFKANDQRDKALALKTMEKVLINLSKLMAPFTPFIAESIWQKVTKFDFKDLEHSVHLEAWPELSGEKLSSDENKVLETMAKARQIIELGLAKRDQAGMKIRQMLASLNVQGSSELESEYQELIKAELNIKELIFSNPQAEHLEVELDTVLTPELKQEGLKRELIRSINLLRKEKNLSIQDQATVYYQSSADLSSNIEELKEEVAHDTLAQDLIKVSEFSSAALKKNIKFFGEVIILSLDQ